MRWRYLLILGFFICVFFAITAKLFYWQVIDSQELSLLAQSQYGQLVQINPQRGDILASDKFPLVTNRLSYVVFANPKETRNPDAISKMLSPLLSVDSATISALLSMDRYWVSLKSNATYQEKDAVSKLNLPGIGFTESYTRFYPEA